MNCIFICVFNNKEYLNLLYILLESIFIYGNLQNNIKILIYTSSNFKQLIMNSVLNSNKIIFQINDNKTNLIDSCRAKLDIFTFNCISMFNKILYLDVDTIVKKDINCIFDCATKDILYTVEEGSIELSLNWGSNLFLKESKLYNDKSAFSTGVLLFNNCEMIKNLFITISEHILNTTDNLLNDKPYIIYNSFKYNMYDNKILSKYAVNYDSNSNSDYYIHHFSGNLGDSNIKYDIMSDFIFRLNYIHISNIIDITKQYINKNLMSIIDSSGEYLEGNIFMEHETSVYSNKYIDKVKNICTLVLNKNITNVMEIGFNSGFSALLMLIANPNLKITCVDICEHTYTIKCFNELKKTFGDRINLVIGDSSKTLPYLNNTFDLIHIDGCHSVSIAEHDIINSMRMCKQGTIVIMDDYEFEHIKYIWDIYVKICKLSALNLILYNTEYHDIKYLNLNN